jgi:hypothetical protein
MTIHSSNTIVEEDAVSLKKKLFGYRLNSKPAMVVTFEVEIKGIMEQYVMIPELLVDDYKLTNVLPMRQIGENIWLCQCGGSLRECNP